MLQLLSLNDTGGDITEQGLADLDEGVDAVVTLHHIEVSVRQRLVGLVADPCCTIAFRIFGRLLALLFFITIVIHDRII